MTEGFRLLLVEDDDDVALMIGKALERAGHTVTRCRTAAEALNQAGAQRFDLVLLDQNLPDSSGLDLLQTLAREQSGTPTLMVTAFGDEQLATSVLQAGALDYVVKDPALTFLADLPKRVSESIARHRLQQINHLLSAALESARDGVVIADSDRIIRHVNHALERMTGYTRKELVGQTAAIFRSDGQGDEIYAQLWQSVLSRGSWQGELTQKRKDGRLVDVSLTVSSIRDPRGEPTHFVGIHRDITERKQIERQLVQAQKMQSIGTLASGVAHEFNNLLAGVTGYASLGMEDSEATATLREFFQHILTLSDRAASLTRQLLAFARQPPLWRQSVPIEELIHATADLVRRSLRTEVLLDLTPGPDGTPLLVEADIGQMQQALVNLALNSRDAQEGKAASMTFRLRPMKLDTLRPAFPENVPPGEYVVLEVVDRGCGMAPDVLNQALDPFFTTKDVGRGTGLGLPVVFGIVRAHQGLLTIDSSEGVGTTVSIYLPPARKP